MGAWRTLFEIEMSTDKTVPDWYLDEMRRLLRLISEPLSQLRPTLPPEDISLLTRAMFSSVHGIVLLGLEKRISGVPSQDLNRMLETIIVNFSGAAHTI